MLMLKGTVSPILHTGSLAQECFARGFVQVKSAISRMQACEVYLACDSSCGPCSGLLCPFFLVLLGDKETSWPLSTP